LKRGLCAAFFVAEGIFYDEGSARPWGRTGAARPIGQA